MTQKQMISSIIGKPIYEAFLLIKSIRSSLDNNQRLSYARRAVKYFQPNRYGEFSVSRTLFLKLDRVDRLAILMGSGRMTFLDNGHYYFIRKRPITIV